ncbi:sulfatase-like hydrolase/transferase [Enterococcus plantarum]|uniref:sulfatase-like hydrolase/transferase n=1 Tax=Enterococcus plantarum TaxID=1077675 RepID=UPI001A8EF739|nr:sulfatase-like hydrolase/transferase [Enterococcus plantarum]
MKEKSLRLNYIPIIVACLFMVIQRVLQSATVVPEYGSYASRFYIYQTINTIVMVGVNIFPIYLGFNSSKMKDKKVLKNISSYYLMYVATSLLVNIFFYVTKKSLNVKDYWSIFFPISQNHYSYAVSCVLALLCLPKIVRWWDDNSDQQIKSGLLLTSSMFVLLPTLFSKDIWSAQGGKNVVWIFYLLFVGYALKRLNLVQKVRLPILHLLFSGVLLISSIFVMTKISMFMRGDASTALRFCVPFSVLGMYYTLSLFATLQSRKRLKLNVPVSIIATTLISTQVAINSPVATYFIGTFYRKPYEKSGALWFKAIILSSVLWLGAAVLCTIINFLFQKTPVFKWLEKLVRVESVDEVKNKVLAVSKWLSQKRRLVLTAAFFYGFTIVQMFLISESKIKVSVADTVNSYAFILLKRQAPIVLNVLIIMMFFLLLFVLTNKFWHSFVLTLMIDLLITISNYLKMSLREEPVLPADLKMLTGIKEILDMVNPFVILIGVIVVFVLAVSSYLLERRARQLYDLKPNGKKRITVMIVILVFFSSLFFVNHKNSPSYLMFNFFRVNRYFYNQKLGAQINGPIVQFLNNIDITIMDKPAGYSETAIQKIMEKYDKEANEINSNRLEWAENETFIFNLSESFSDPKRVPNLTIENDPIPYIRQTMKKNTSGWMLSNGYGGGTANMEWSSLTSLDISNLSPTLPTPYTQLVEKQLISPNITNLFDESIAIHPYAASLYNRKNVFNKFGFDKFYYVDGPDKLTYEDKIDDHIYISDASAYKETLEKINDNFDKTQFIQLSTMQNHMPYKENFYHENNYSFSGTAVVKDRQQELSTFMQGIHYTDEAVEEFIKELDKIEKPITFVFYGDHLPSIYSGNNMSKYGLVQHETDYFIYSNRYSRERSKKVNKKIVSPYNFPALALQQANVKITPFYALMTRVTNDILASTTDPSASISNNYNGQKIFVTNKNESITEDKLTKKQKELLQDYRLLQYDLTAGEEYASEWAMQSWNE